MDLNGQDPDDEEVFDLSPFVVEDRYDRGYFASNSISGTRLNTAIRDVPMNLEVVTSEFIRDTGATNLREALRYSAGVVLESQSDAFAEPDFDSLSAGANDPRGVTRSAGDSSTKLRGFIGDQTLREGFRRQFAADSIKIDRVEILRGPSALLYGIGNFGGVINFVPKKPQYDSEYYYFGAPVGNHGFKRAEFDATGPLEDNDTYRPAYRITASAQERGNFTEHYIDRYFTVSPSFSFNLFPGTQVLIENEFGYREEFGVGFQNIRNNYGDEAASPGRNATWVTDIFDENTGAKIGENVDNRAFRWSGPDAYLRGPYRNHLIDIEQQLGPDAILKVGYAISNTTFNSRQIQGGPTRSPFDHNISSQAARGNALEAPLYSVPISRQNSVNEAPEGLDNAVIQYEWKDVNRDEERQQVRAELLYFKDTESLGIHSVILGSQYMRMTSVESLWGPPRAYPGTFVSRLDRYSYKNPTDYSPFRFGVQGDGLPDNQMVRITDLNRRSWDLGYYGIYQGQFFNHRLTIVGGLRHDRNDARETTRFVWEDRKDDLRDRIGDKAPSSKNYQFGVSVGLNDNVSLFAVYSTGVVPNHWARDGNGNIMNPTKAKNLEIGIKFDMLDRRVSGTISYYQIERKGHPRFLWWAPSPYESMQQGWDPDLPSTTVLWYPTPDAFHFGIHETSGRSSAEMAEVAKRIFPEYRWHEMIDEIAANPDNLGEDWANYGPQAGSFWDWAWEAEGPTNNPPSTTNAPQFYFPLVNYSDPDVAAFMASIHGSPGWNGNYYYEGGQVYFYGDGTPGEGNAPSGSGASVPMDDKATGVDVNLFIEPIEGMQVVFNYSYLDRKVTTRTYQFVEAPYWPAGWWYQSDRNFGTLNPDLLAEDVYTDVTDTTTYNATIPDYQQRGDDSPEHTISLWVRYQLGYMAEPLEGWTVGFGGYWQDRRQWFTGFVGGGGNVAWSDDEDDEQQLVQLWTRSRLTLNSMIEYRTQFRDRYSARFALNIDNLTNDKKLYGLIYAPGISYRLSAGIDF
ncbi:MAG: TonB-dependent receptor plug domain-containing protein [Opitutales bacterium]|nr:TonB-dependent receptor plug domain-containing protein [Opitutales bacterium]